MNRAQKSPPLRAAIPWAGGRYLTPCKPLILPGQAAIFVTAYRYGNTTGKIQNPLEPSQPVTTRHLPPE